MKNTKSIIEAENISLTYHISQSFSLKKVFTKTELDKEKYTVHAVKDVSFTLDKSQNLGIVGSNGSGKSTLLRMLSKTYAPDSGKLLVNTLSTQLLTLGAGFFNELTGRDNLYLNALLLGLKKEDLNNGLADEIIAFSELEQSIDLPMFTYSSGMRSRLTFSVSACVQPELLLLDEVFSVGDAHFKEKSEKRIQEMIKSDKSVVMITHDENAIEDHCDHAMWLHKGEMKMFGDAKHVMKEYLDFTK